ncbi:hypothetical protein G647_04039 [Cladophialophora carrionii CBS 160.54]|uniref:Zn(2)-C6 fungal-type domain-containing protein n=1 Tax=Cladophialophora carrionii CBS 160.54 TaxID=1279043 RepID=V9DCT9_9EURO|nr:uncharacterized protein G647_04039 [Cladophialophora carrionii CBS 160.54]ETI24670.1 hypothetical protein G647_04039 [Cladophialophora carrionii CBS 160.54]
MPKERQTCTECSMRRQKCDRNLPCGRCVKRGDADKCTREWPEGGYDPRKHRIYPRSSTAAQASPASTTASPRTTQINIPESAVHPSLRTPKSVNSGPSPRELPPAHPIVFNPQPTNGPEQVADNTAPVLEFLTWGRNKLSDYDLKALELLKEPHQTGNAALPKDTGSDWDISNGFGGTGAAQVSFLQLLLPNRKQVFQLVEYHVSSVLWYHGCFYGPTFYDELKEVYKGPSGMQVRNMDLRWTGLLFAVMAASMTCASEQMAQSWGFKKNERAKLTRQWYKATVTCLNLADYMWRHHVYSVQAITTLTMSAHILGFSNTQSTLLGAAVKIAQGLGLQRLGPEDDTNTASGTLTPSAPAQRDRVIRRETGRRIWQQLCIQDWFSIPFSEMYSIQKLHFTTLKPIHCDDDTMELLPEDVPSMTSFPTFLCHIAGLMPQMHDAIISSNTLYTKYEQVLDYDAQMRSLATEGLPRFFDVREAIQPEWPAWVPWARRSLTICFAHKIIMIHRAFLGRSFTEHTFDFTRRTCMAAAKTILKEARQAYDEEGPMLWIDQAFMVAAGITLALDIFHRKPNEPEFEEHRKLVENTIVLLGKFENSMIAMRGIRLLSSLLAEQARLTADQTLENYRKRTHDSMSGDRSQPKRQKFNVPKFVENFVGNDSFTHSLRTANRGVEPSLELYEPTDSRSRTPGSQDPIPISDLGYETFEQLFPPHTGISNNFLFEDLLNFDIQEAL